MKSFKIKYFLIILIFNSFYGFVDAQKLVFDNIKNLNLLHQVAIKSDDTVKRYLLIYERDTIDNNTNYFKIALTTNNLVIYSQFEVELHQESVIIETSSNETEILINIFHKESKLLEYQILDFTGKTKFNYTRNLSNKEFKQLAFNTKNGFEDVKINSIQPVDSSGFISNTQHLNKSFISISIDFYNSKAKKNWNYVPKIGASYFYGEYLGVYNNVVFINLITFKSSVYTEQPNFFIVGLDLNTGKELFKKSTSSENIIIPKVVKTLADGTGVVFGSYFNKKADLRRDKSEGFALWEINSSGDVLKEKYISYENDFYNYFDMSATGRIKGIGSIYFHDMVQSKSKDFYFLGECHTKVVNTVAAITANLLFFTGWITFGGVTKEVSTDMVLFNFDSNMVAKEISFFDKKNSDYFCYDKTQNNKSSSLFSFWYYSNNFKKINSINITNDEVKMGKLNLNANKSRALILPASNGQVLLMEYFKLEKKLELRFEKFK